VKIGPSCPEGGMRKWEVIISQALSRTSSLGKDRIRPTIIANFASSLFRYRTQVELLHPILTLSLEYLLMVEFTIDQNGLPIKIFFVT